MGGGGENLVRVCHAWGTQGPSWKDGISRAFMGRGYRQSGDQLDRRGQMFTIADTSRPKNLPSLESDGRE